MEEITKKGVVSSKLIEYTCENSNFDTHRDYISLSHINEPIGDIINQFHNGYSQSQEIMLKCYKGYQMENDLLKRLEKIYGHHLKTGIEISVYNGIVKGHPDFSLAGYPGDCKSVLMDDWLPVGNRVPRRVYYQMQAYMFYCFKDKSVVIFESRQSGKIVDIWLNKNQRVQEEIQQKINYIIATL